MDSQDDFQPTADSTTPSVRRTPAFAGSVELPSRYEVLNELGRGGMGLVYKARDRETDEVVAIKVLLPEIAANEAAMERFINELRLARRITHKNVCRIHEFHRSGSTACIAMEFVEGDSLRAIFQRTGLNLRKAMDVTRQICAGLREAHAQEVVHRDLKPENLMLDRSGVIKIMDFGIARSAGGGSTLTGALIGTPAYMSPEQASGKTVDHRSDVYSLGLILYEMFTGSVAFHGETPVEVALKQVQEAPDRPREKEPLLPRRLEKVILRCLEKDPAKRYQTVDELESALAAPEEETAPRPVAEEQKEVVLPLRLTRWQRWDYALLAAAVVSMAAFLFLFDMVYPFSAATPRLSIEAAQPKAEAFLRRVDPSRSLKPGRPGISIWRYEPNVLAEGLSEALRVEAREGGWWFFPLGAEGEWLGSLMIGPEGQLQNLYFSSNDQGLGERPSVEAVMPQARALAKDLYGLDLQPSVVKSGPGGGTDLLLRWEIATEGSRTRAGFFRFGSHGLVATGLFTSVRPDAATEERARIAREQIRVAGTRPLTRYVLLGLGALLLILFFLRRLYHRTSPSALWTAAWGTLASVWYLWGELPKGSELTALALAAPAGLLLAYAFIRVPEQYLATSLPLQAATWLSLPKQGLRAQAAGLSLWRGCAWGFCYLTLHTVLLLLLGQTKVGAANVDWLSLISFFRTTTWTWVPAGISTAVLGTIAAGWCFLALPAAIAHRARPGRTMVLLIPAVFCLLTASSLPGAEAVPTFPLYLFAGLQGLFFAWLLWQFDFLTAVAAIFTVETWMLAYPVYVVFYRANWPGAAAGMLPWFVMLLAGLTLYFRRDLGDAGRRLAAIFQ